MKYPLPPNTYTFNAAAKTITFSGTIPAAIVNIMHITNITRGVLYFQPQAGAALSATYSSPTLILAASTSGHSNSDELLIIYDDGQPTLPTGAATAANQSTLLGRVPTLQSGAVPVGDNSSSITVDGKAYRSTVTITRPSNTTAYSAGDVVGDTSGSAIITLSSIGPTNGFVLIQSVALMFSDSSVPSGMSSFRVHFYTASPTAIADNAVFNIPSGDRAGYAGFVDLATPTDMGSSLYVQADYCGRLVRLAAASTSLFALIETRGAYTPVSASTVELRVATLEASL